MEESAHRDGRGGVEEPAVTHLTAHPQARSAGGADGAWIGAQSVAALMARWGGRRELGPRRAPGRCSPRGQPARLDAQRDHAATVPAPDRAIAAPERADPARAGHAPAPTRWSGPHRRSAARKGALQPLTCPDTSSEGAPSPRQPLGRPQHRDRARYLLDAIIHSSGGYQLTRNVPYWASRSYDGLRCVTAATIDCLGGACVG